MGMNPSGEAMIGFGVQIGGNGRRELHQPQSPITTAQEKLDAERLSGRMLRLAASYVATAAQPSYGFMSFQPVQSGRIQEVLFISVWGIDPFSSVAQTQTDVSANGQGAASVITAQIPGAAGQTSYISGFSVTGLGATAGTVVQVTISGLIGSNQGFYLSIPAGVTTPITPLFVEFARPIPASAPNTSITVTVPSFGAGNTNAEVTAHGYTQANASSLAGQVAGFISTFVPQDSNVEPPFPNLVLAASTLPVINAPTRRQVLVFPNERFVLAFKGLANNSQVQASIAVAEYELGTFIKGVTP